MIRVTVEFWGPARDWAKTESAVVELLDGGRVADLRTAMAAKDPTVGQGLKTARLAIHDEFVDDARLLRSGDVVSVIPPVSGG